MKRQHILTILASALLLGSCTNVEELTPGTAPGTSEIQDADAVVALFERTRTSLDMSGNVVWSSGDRIRLFAETAPGGGTYVTTSEGTRTGIFAPDNSSQTVTADTRYAVYPAAAAEGAELTGTTLDIDLSILAEQPYVQSLGAGADLSPVPMIAVSEDNTFLFRNICGAVQLQVSDWQNLRIKIRSVAVKTLGGEQIAGKATVDFADGSCTVAKGSDATTVTVVCGEGANIAGGNDPQKGSGFLVFLPAGTYEGFAFTLTDTEGRCYAVETAQPVTVEAGVVTPLKTLPLTLYYGTANCYRVAGAQTIAIDAAPYYTFSDRFVHEGLRCLDAAGSPTGAPQSARIVWQQPATNASGDVVSTAAMEGTTLKVTTSGQLGNALVAVCDAAGEILWSYHIWVSDAADIVMKNLADLSAEDENFEYRPEATLLDRNLGATSTEVKDRNAYGLFYQWGRKDPFPRNLQATRPGGSPYEADPSPLEKTATADDSNSSMGWATKHPDTRLLASNDWHLACRIQGLWGNPDAKFLGSGKVAPAWTVGTGVKTVFDPCPEGYRVPEGIVFSGLTDKDKGNCNAQYGYMFDCDGAGTTNYFPTVGYLNKSTDRMMYLEYRAYLWSNVPGGTGCYYFYYNNSNLNYEELDRAAGLGIRCMKIAD